MVARSISQYKTNIPISFIPFRCDFGMTYKGPLSSSTEVSTAQLSVAHAPCFANIKYAESFDAPSSKVKTNKNLENIEKEYPKCISNKRSLEVNFKKKGKKKEKKKIKRT